jgi:hypothetical protein
VVSAGSTNESITAIVAAAIEFDAGARQRREFPNPWQTNAGQGCKKKAGREQPAKFREETCLQGKARGVMLILYKSSIVKPLPQSAVM